MLPTPNVVVDLDRLRRSASERDEMRREHETRQEQRAAEERERKARLAHANDADRARADADAWAQIDARIMAYMEPLGPMLGDRIVDAPPRRYCRRGATMW